MFINVFGLTDFFFALNVVACALINLSAVWSFIIGLSCRKLKLEKLIILALIPIFSNFCLMLVVLVLYSWHYIVIQWIFIIVFMSLGVIVYCLFIE